MLKSLRREITLSIQAKNGMSAAVAVWMMVVVLACLTAFIFLCIGGYAFLAQRFDPIAAGLIMAGIFAGVALIAAVMTALVRRRVRERAILARAAKAHASLLDPRWLLDPRLLGVAAQAGRSLGWQRLIPIALVGFMAAQWAREHRERRGEQQL